MRKLVVIDLTFADVDLFEDYERKVIPLLDRHGGRMKLGVRSVDGATETHVLHFPDRASFESFLSDPVRIALQDEWKRVGATAAISDVKEIDYLPLPGAPSTTTPST